MDERHHGDDDRQKLERSQVLVQVTHSQLMDKPTQFVASHFQDSSAKNDDKLSLKKDESPKLFANEYDNNATLMDVRDQINQRRVMPRRFPKPNTSNRPATTNSLTMEDEITLTYISKSKDNRLLSTIKGINIFSEHLKPLVRPDEVTNKTKWLNDTVIDAYIEILKDMQPNKPTALLQNASQCQV
uniref:Uncharacterized protein n=1 Tax=Oryza brachyantha TaxID=4533 RepID=J3LW00_ORYBR